MANTNIDNGYNIKQLCMTFVTGHRFYATILAKLVKQASTQVATAGVGWTPNGKLVMVYNEQFMKSQDIRVAQFVITHEILHVFFRHLFRFKMAELSPHERELANIAMDMAINQLIKDAPRTIPDGKGGTMDLIFPDLYKDIDGNVFPDNKSSEYYFNLLKESIPSPQEKPQQGQGQPSDCETCKGTGEDPNQSPPEGEEGEDGQGNGSEGKQPPKPCPDCGGSGKNDQHDQHDQGGNGNTADSHEMWDKVIEEETDTVGNVKDYDIDVEYATTQIVKEAISECRKFGKMPAFVEAEIEAMRDVVKKHDWAREIKLAVNSVRSNKTKFSQKRVNKRSLEFDYFLPGKKKSRRPKIIIFRDTSGSMYNETVQQKLLNEVLSLANLGPVMVGDVDTMVHDVYEVKRASDLKKPKGGGGTCFIEAFEVAKKEDADIVIYLTDTDGSFPEKKDVGKFAHHTVWVTFDDSRDIKSRIPFGRHVNIGS